MYIPLQLFGDLNHPQMLHLIDLYNFGIYNWLLLNSLQVISRKYGRSL